MRWQRRWGFPGVDKVIRGDRAISADTAVRLGKYFGLQRRNFGSIFRAATISALQRAASAPSNSSVFPDVYGSPIPGRIRTVVPADAMTLPPLFRRS